MILYQTHLVARYSEECDMFDLLKKPSSSARTTRHDGLLGISASQTVDGFHSLKRGLAGVLVNQIMAGGPLDSKNFFVRMTRQQRKANCQYVIRQLTSTKKNYLFKDKEVANVFLQDKTTVECGHFAYVYA